MRILTIPFIIPLLFLFACSSSSSSSDSSAAGGSVGLIESIEDACREFTEPGENEYVRCEPLAVKCKGNTVWGCYEAFREPHCPYWLDKQECGEGKCVDLHLPPEKALYHVSAYCDYE